MILLRDDQIISNQLSFANVTVEHLEITGTVNGYSINEIFQNTFTVSGFTVCQDFSLDPSKNYPTSSIPFSFYVYILFFLISLCQLFGDQKITGDIIFHGNVLMKSNFDPHFVNDIDTSKLISLHESGKLNGKISISLSLIDFYQFYTSFV